MANPITEDAILTHLTICPMTADELAEDLKADPSKMARALADLQHAGAVKGERSSRVEGGGLLYSLPGFRPDNGHLGEDFNPYLCRDYGGQYENPFPV